VAGVDSEPMAKGQGHLKVSVSMWSVHLILLLMHTDGLSPNEDLACIVYYSRVLDRSIRVLQCMFLNTRKGCGKKDPVIPA